MYNISIKKNDCLAWRFIASLIFTMCFSTSSYSQADMGNVQILTVDGAWCWFQDPRAIYLKGEYERLYTQWMTHDGKLQVGAYDVNTGKKEIYTLKQDWDADDHNVGAFLVLKDKRIMVFYARHNQQGIYCQTTSQPEDITLWENEITISDSPRITYAHPIYLSKEKKFYVFWRGPTWKPTFATSTDGKIWSEPVVLVQDSARESSSIRPYTKITSNGKSSIHIAFTDGHPAVEPQNSVYYLKYEKGQFFKADGSIVGDMSSLPIRHTKSDIVYDGKTNDVRAWVWDIALDKNRYPVIAYTQLPEETDHRYHYVRWNGKSWQDSELVAAGKWFPQTPAGTEEREVHYSGGIGLDPVNPSIVYISRQVNGIFEIQRWQSSDNGKSWQSTPITKNSTHLNVRPVIPAGLSKGDEFVLWMFGDYEHYTSYRTGIKLLSLQK